jgi:6,7-dimethyl-8-ribityllumazine synthase
MPKYFEGQLTGKGVRVGIVVSRFNHFITERLLEGALDALKRHGVADEDIAVYRVPGSFEIPLVARKIATSAKFEGVLCVGALIRGGTPHFDFISAEVTKGVAATALESGIPMTFGVLTTDTIEQAIERAGTKAGNKGWEAALALLELINLYQTLD